MNIVNNKKLSGAAFLHRHPLCSGVLLAAAMTVSSAALALPRGATVTHGDVTITNAGNELHITQGGNTAIVEWDSFNVDLGETLNVLQPGAQAALLSRVIGADPSQLLGDINANGRFYLINPNGIVVGSGANINVGEFIASTLDVADEDFLNGGSLLFEGDNSNHVINLGKITAENGDVILLAHHTVNEGDIDAEAGTAVLAAGDRIRLTPTDNQRVSIEASVPRGVETGVDNSGVINAVQAELKAAGGSVYDLAINQSGVVRATGVSASNGRIILTSDQGDIAIDGELSAHNLDGSGGEIFVGGGDRGNNPEIANAAAVTVSDDSVINIASAGSSGDGGHAVFWADEQMTFRGHIDGQGGVNAGDGGYVEVSSPKDITYSGLADLRANNGETGTLLIDPDAATISTAADGGNNFNNTTVNNNLAVNNFIINTSTAAGDVSVNAAVTWSSGNTFGIKSGESININADINGGSNGTLALSPGHVLYDFGGPGLLTTGDINLYVNASITANTLVIAKNPDAFVMPSNQPGNFMGSINLAGVVNVNTLDIQRSDDGLGATAGLYGPFPAVDGSVTIDNAANSIATLTSSAGSGSIYGDMTIVDGSGNLSISGVFPVVGGDITISTLNDLTLQAETQYQATQDAGNGGNIYLAANTGSFINNAGATAVQPDAINGSRFLIYSDDPANTVTGGLTANPVYNTTFAANAPASVTQAGNRFMYSLAPVLTLTADDKTRAEGESNPLFTYSISGLVGGDTALGALSGDPFTSTIATAGSPLGDYDIDIAQGTVVLSDFGYTLNLVTGTLSVEIDPLRELTITADDMMRIYGEDNPLFTASFDGFRIGDDESVVSHLQFTTTATLQSGVGNYAITPFGASAVNYSITYVPGILTIDARPLTIQADDLIKVYGEIGVPTATYTGLASFHTEADAPVNLTSVGAGNTASVNNYDINIAQTTVTSNYDVTLEMGTLSVTPRPVTVSIGDITRFYGDPTVGFSSTVSNRAPGVPFDTSGFVYSTNATQSSDVGIYTIVGAGIVDSNYTVSYNFGELTIEQAPLDIGIGDFQRDYGDPNADFNSFISVDAGDLKLGHSIGDVLADLRVDTAADIFSSVGNYTLQTAATQLNSNYAVNFGSGQLTINKFLLPFLGVELSERFYGDPDPEFQFAATGLRNGDTADVISGSIFALANDDSGVGNYVTRILSANATNYSFSGFTDGTLDILPRPLTITVGNVNREYGLVNPMFDVVFDSLASFDDPSAIGFTGLEIPGPTAPGLEDIGLHVGDWVVAPVFTGNPNYDITAVNGLLTVTPAPLAFKNVELSKLYGFGTPEVLPELLPDQLRAGDDVSVLGSIQVESLLGIRDVGDYPINVSVANPNYFAPSPIGTFSIAPAPLVIRTQNVARLYGEAGAEDNLVSTIAGLAYDDQPGNVVRVTNDVDKFTDAGTYSAIVTILDSNYELGTLVGGDIVILPRQIALRPANASRVYGDFTPAIDVLVAGLDGLASFHSVEDLVADIRITDPVTRAVFLSSILAEYPATDERFNVGNRVLDVVLNEDSSIRRNYVIDTSPGLFSILPRPITLGVVDVNIGYNDPIPTDYDLFATNLASFDSLDDPALQAELIDLVSFNIVDDDVAPVLYVPPTPEYYDGIAAYSIFSEEDFYTLNPARTEPVTILTPVPEFGRVIPCGGDCISTITRPIIPVEIDAGDTVVLGTVTDGTIVLSDFDGSISTGDAMIDSILAGGLTRGPEVLEVPGPTLRYIQPTISLTGFTNNYVVTGVSNGVLSIAPDPEIVAAIEKTNTENRILYEFESSAYRNSFGHTGSSSILFVNGITNAIESGDTGLLGEFLQDYCDRNGIGACSSESLPDGEEAITRELKLFAARLANAEPGSADFETAKNILSLYGQELLSRPVSELAGAELQFANNLRLRMESAKSVMIQALKDARDARLAEMEVIDSGMSDLFGRDVGWADVIGDATGMMIETSLSAGEVAAVSAIGGVSAGALAALAAAPAAIVLPYSVGATTTAAGATIAGGSSVLVGTSAVILVPLAITAGAIAGSVARGIQVFKDEDAKNEFDAMLAGGGLLDTSADGINFDGMDSDDTNESLQAQIVNALYIAAFSGQMVSDAISASLEPGEILVTSGF